MKSNNALKRGKNPGTAVSVPLKIYFLDLRQADGIIPRCYKYIIHIKQVYQDFIVTIMLVYNIRVCIH